MGEESLISLMVHFMVGSLSKGMLMDKEFLSLKMAHITKETFMNQNSMEKDKSTIKIKNWFIKESGKMAYLVDMVLNNQSGTDMKGNLISMGKKLAMANMLGLMAKNIRDNLKMELCMVMEHFMGQMVRRFMPAIINRGKRKEKEFSKPI